MVALLSIEQTRQIESQANENGLSYAQMMDNAGYATAQYALHMLRPITSKRRVTVLVGGGNNGGDGLVAGKYLAQQADTEVRFYLVKRLDVAFIPYKEILDMRLFVAYAEDDRDLRVLRHMVASADLIVDALLGIGARLPITGDIERILRMTKQAIKERQQELALPPLFQPTNPMLMPQILPPRILAVDCPSGLNCDTGEVDTHTLQANATITFIAPKIGLVKYPASDFVGELIIAPIDIPTSSIEKISDNIQLASASMIKPILPTRPSYSNKGTFGKSLIIGGSTNYIGASGLSGYGAYRSGVGLVTIAAPTPIVTTLAGHLIEPTWVPLNHQDGMITSDAVQQIVDIASTYNAHLIGPGLGLSSTTSEFLKALLKSAHGITKLVLDADALNILAKIHRWWDLLPSQTIITPHPGEMARLCGISVQDVQSNRWELASQKAKEWDVIILLKGAHTVIASPDGKICIMPFKNDALATAGTGDILAGLIVGLLAQGASAFDATRIGAYVHGLSGEIAYSKHRTGRSVIAGDVLVCIPMAMAQIQTT